METPLTKSKHTTLFSSHVRVALRVRPFLPSEIQSDGSKLNPCVSLLDQVGEEVTVHLKDQWTSRNECYKLDSFFGGEAMISQIFDKEVSSLIPGIFQGINATVFAYGATGSGKTYTMQGTEKEPGIIPLAISAILAMSQNTQCSVGISFYEVYLDRCYDLLEPKAREVKALDDKTGRVQLRGLSWVPVSTMGEFAEVFSTGIRRRKVAHTDLNDVSSRSHAVLAIEVRNGVNGKLNLIDLAGNEDNRRTCNEGIRLKESAKINQSLFALSNVIHALNHNERRIPYRESKLTRILQDSLGRGSPALMIACLNPGHYQEAVHTVSLAARSRQIVNYFGSGKRKETSTEMVDMDAKLRAWLESRGKTKSINRMNGLCSPPSRIAPTPLSHLKNSKSIMDHELVVTPNSKGRKLFAFGSHVSTCEEETRCHTEFTYSMKDEPSQMELDTNYESHELLLPQKVKSNNNNCENQLHMNEVKIVDLQEKSIERAQEVEADNCRKAFSTVQPTNKSPLSLGCKKSEMRASTQTDTFNAFSSNLKESLVEEYISFLNVASKEELMQLKGIGPKRAEYILGLRENSPTPIKSLVDLEHIGLSSKQVQSLLRRGAGGLFT